MKVSRNIIYLIGFSGSGKTTIGKLLAKKLHADFYDTDDVIVRETNKDIARLFSEKGEKYFRTLEQLVIQKITLSDTGNKVISLGGGAFQMHANRQFVSKHGISLYLSCSQLELYKRLKDKTDRPLLQHKSKCDEPGSSELKRKIRTLMYQRINNYKKADMTVSTTSKSKTEIVNQIKKKLNNYAGH